MIAWTLSMLFCSHINKYWVRSQNNRQTVTIICLWELREFRPCDKQFNYSDQDKMTNTTRIPYTISLTPNQVTNRASADFTTRCPTNLFRRLCVKDIANKQILDTFFVYEAMPQTSCTEGFYRGSAKNGNTALVGFAAHLQNKTYCLHPMPTWQS